MNLPVDIVWNTTAQDPAGQPQGHPWWGVLAILAVLLGHLGLLVWLPAPRTVTPPPVTVPVQVRWVSLASPPAPAVPPVSSVPQPRGPAQPVPRPVSLSPVPVRPAPVSAPAAVAMSAPATPAQGMAPAEPQPLPVATPTVSPAPVTPAPAHTAAPAQGMVADNPAAAAAPAAPAAAPRTLALEGVRYRREPVLSYPESARQTGDQGTVLLRVWVNEQGGIEAVSLQCSSGSRLLDQAAQQQIRTALFEPYREQGVAQAVFVLVPLHFELDEEPF